MLTYEVHEITKLIITGTTNKHFCVTFETVA